MSLTVLRFYGLSEADPQEWREDNSDDELAAPESHLPEDETDPLGLKPSVNSVLEARGVPVQHNLAVRSKYLVASKRFSSSDFLRDVHGDTSFEDLEHSLQFLENSIDKRSDALKRLVQDNFSCFVNANSTLNSVYESMKSHTLKADDDWGLEKLRRLLDESNAKAAQIMKPVLDNNSKAERLTYALYVLEKYKYLFNLPSSMIESIRQADHESVVQDYKRGLDMVEETRCAAERLKSRPPGQVSDKALDAALQQRRITDKIWSQVEVVAESYRSSIWTKLKATGPDNNYLQFISILLDLGVNQSPIMVWLKSRVDELEKDIEATFRELTEKFSVIRRNAYRINPQSARSNNAFNAIEHPAQSVVYLRQPFNRRHGSSASTSIQKDTDPVALDMPELIEIWIMLKMSSQESTFKYTNRIISFWESANGFIEGRHQRALPTGWRGQSKQYLSLSQSDVTQLKNDGKNLINLLFNLTTNFFTSSFGDEATNGGGEEEKNENESDHLFSLYSKYMFIPPGANALGAEYYLSQIMNIIISSAVSLANLQVSSQSLELIRTSLISLRERFIGGVSLCWQTDCTRLRYVEKWDIYKVTDSKTEAPAVIRAYQESVLEGLTRVIFVDGTAFIGNTKTSVIPSPSSQLLNNVQTQFLNSIHTIKESLMETIGGGGGPSSQQQPPLLKDGVLDYDSRMLLLICNLRELRKRVLPALSRAFSNLIKVELVGNTISSILKSIGDSEEQLFTSFVEPRTVAISSTLREGILSHPSIWDSHRRDNNIVPTDVSQYIYEVLLLLVLADSQVSRVAPKLLGQVIVCLVERSVNVILECLRQLDSISLYGSIQAFIDIQFYRSTLSNYLNQRATETADRILLTITDISGIPPVKPASRESAIISATCKQAAQSNSLTFKCFQRAKSTSRPSSSQ